MKVQEIDTPKGKRWLLLNGNYEVVPEVRDYIKYLDNLGRAPNTLKNYTHHLKIYYEYLEIINLSYDEIASQPKKSSLEILADFMGWLEYPHYFDDIINLSVKVRSDSTINIIVNTVLDFYDFLAKKGSIEGLDVYTEKRKFIEFKSFLYELIDKNKLVKTSLLKKRTYENVETKFVTREEYYELLDYCVQRRDKLLLGLLFEGGLRIGEALGLFIEDVEIWNNKINLVSRDNLINDARVKNHAEGAIYLPDYLMDTLQDYILEDLDPYDTNYLFINIQGETAGEPLRAATVGKLFERLSKHIGFKVTPHMLRHGRGTELHEVGWSQIEIKDDLRHRSITSSERYIHITDKRKREALKVKYSNIDLPFGGNEDD